MGSAGDAPRRWRSAAAARAKRFLLASADF